MNNSNLNSNPHQWLKLNKNTGYDYQCSKCNCKKIIMMGINGAKQVPAYSTSKIISSTEPNCT